MQTGYFGPTLARNAPQKPSFGSVISRTLGAQSEHMPPYVTIPKSEAFGYQGAVYLGKSYNPFEVGADPNSKNFKIPNLALPEGLTLKSVESRRELLKKFDTLNREVDKSGVIEGLDSFKTQALEMVTGERVRKAFDLSREDDKLRDQYGRHQYGQSALLARRLVEAGSRCVTINTGYWDHHNEIEKGLEEQLSPLDRAMATLIQDLEQRGMLNDVLIFCAGGIWSHSDDQWSRGKRSLVKLFHRDVCRRWYSRRASRRCQRKMGRWRRGTQNEPHGFAGDDLSKAGDSSGDAFQ